MSHGRCQSDKIRPTHSEHSLPLGKMTNEPCLWLVVYGSTNAGFSSSTIITMQTFCLLPHSMIFGSDSIALPWRRERSRTTRHVAEVPEAKWSCGLELERKVTRDRGCNTVIMTLIKPTGIGAFGAVISLDAAKFSLIVRP
jgi:hypothetical protein